MTKQAITHKHKVGDELLAFGCPIDKTEPEGVCVIVALRKPSHYYDVCFEDEPDVTYSRFIY